MLAFRAGDAQIRETKCRHETRYLPLTAFAASRLPIEPTEPRDRRPPGLQPLTGSAQAARWPAAAPPRVRSNARSYSGALAHGGRVRN